MDHPVKEIAGVVTQLTTGSPQEQEDALNTYFLSNASFSHPFYRVPSFSAVSVPILGPVDSRRVLLCIYQWYRTLSPKIIISIDSAVFDQQSGLLYVSIRQTFALWFVPFYRAPVQFVCRLKLSQRASWSSSETVTNGRLVEAESQTLSGPGRERAKYFIESQEDLYPMTDIIQFLLPGLGSFLWYLWQLYSTFLCAVGSLLLMPLYLVLNQNPTRSKHSIAGCCEVAGTCLFLLLNEVQRV